MTPQQLLAKTLVDLRKKANLSQQKLSKLADLDRTYISLIERAERNPTVVTLIAICKALDVKPSKVLSMIGQ